MSPSPTTMWLTVPVSVEHSRLDRFLRRLFPDLSNAHLQKTIRKGWIRVNDTRQKEPSFILTVGDQVGFPHFLQEAQTLQQQENRRHDLRIPADIKTLIEQSILFRHKDYLVLNKPAGFSVQGGTNIQYPLNAILSEILKCKIYPVHRLDKETTGICCFALNAEAASTLSEEFQSHQLEKIYWAILDGIPSNHVGSINLPLKKEKGENHLEIQVVDYKSGKKAHTDYRVQGHYKSRQLTWIEFRPQTGRTHQLRAHAKYGLECPILGDYKYNHNTNEKQHLMLHAKSLSGNFLGTYQLFEADVPQPMEDLLQRFK